MDEDVNKCSCLLHIWSAEGWQGKPGVYLDRHEKLVAPVWTTLPCDKEANGIAVTDKGSSYNRRRPWFKIKKEDAVV